MIKIHLESVKGLSFKGYIEVIDLTPAQFEELHCDNEQLTVEVEGDFGVCGDYDDAQIDDISAFATNGIYDFELNEENSDIDTLCNDILDTDIGQQLLERAMMRAEAWADSMEDR